MRQGKPLFLTLNVISIRISLYGIKEILKHYHYLSDPKVGQGIVEIRIIPCSCHSCTTTLPLSWDFKNEESVSQPRYGKVYNCEYYQVLGCNINCILFNFYDGIYEKNYKHINQTIVDGNVMNMYSVIMEGKYDTIDADNYLCHNYYIIKFALSPYTSTILVATGPQYPTVYFIQNF